MTNAAGCFWIPVAISVGDGATCGIAATGPKQNDSTKEKRMRSIRNKNFRKGVWGRSLFEKEAVRLANRVGLSDEEKDLIIQVFAKAIKDPYMDERRIFPVLSGKEDIKA